MRTFSLSIDLDDHEGLFDTLDQARTAWVAAGRPKECGNSVWVSVYDTETFETLNTITLEGA